MSVVPYDGEAKAVSDRIVAIHRGEEEDGWDISDGDIHAYAKAAVADIFDDTSTLLKAPHGYLFRKPSGQEERYFIRAGNLLRNPATLSVFNYLLLRVLPPACSTIYIDSFTILSFALGLKSLVRYFSQHGSGEANPLQIESMHSYKMSKEFRIPNKRDYLILISASTSGGLADKLVAEKEADRERIIHLLGVAPKGSALEHSSIYFRSVQPAPLVHHSRGVIEIGTEEFIVAQGSPRAVRISRAHVDRNASKELEKEFYFDALKLHEPRSNPQTGYSTLSVVAGAEQRRQSPVMGWVAEKLVHEIPGSVRMVIHLDDGLSKWVSFLLKKELGGRVNVRSATQIQTLDLPSSIVVIAFQDDDLEGFRRVNIVLRHKRFVHCHYVVCYAFPNSRPEFQRLKDDLRQSKGLRRGWSNYLVLPVGNADLHESFALDGEALSEESVAPLSGVLGDRLVAALYARHRRPTIPQDGLFLPRIDGRPIKLRPGSIFLGVNEPAACQLTTYAMVSSAMQNARDRGKDGEDGGLTFDENPFVRAVLDPSMFVRFSDGILQASLLRSAHPAELDYSASDDLSGQFATTGLSVIYGCENEVGDAALEFIYALATKKVKLRQADRAKLCEEIWSNPRTKAIYELFSQRS